MQRSRTVYTGKVQGVFFRANCQKKAISLGLTGWVRNRSDGSVECLAQGPEDRIRELIEWNQNNQPHARVDDVRTVMEQPDNDLKGFEIRR